MPQPISIVDAFTDRPFGGNPAAVCILPGPADETWMKNVAREMNLAETAFLYRLEGDASYALRWLTPAVEVDLCGHATLAAAHILWDEGHIPPESLARFQTRSGWLSAKKRGEEIELDFPELITTPAPLPDGLERALGAEVLSSGTTGMDFLVELATEEILRSLGPDLGVLATIPARGVIVTSRSTSPGYDFVSRFFAPQCGIPEDPVTGSAHCALAPFWGERLGKTEMVGFQASQRGGIVRVRRDSGRVKLGGNAMTIMRGTLIV
ncbi:MAG: phenazine biosynthesis protein PhzF family [Planctomycetota bacterium]|nr:phenazine biosynthesis protein PhzF family [Planctomycetota bacterium]